MMKILTFIFLLANIVLFAWQFQQPQHYAGQTQQEAEIKSGLEPILLVSEIKPHRDTIDVKLTEQWMQIEEQKAFVFLSKDADAPDKSKIVEQPADKTSSQLTSADKEKVVKSDVSQASPSQPVQSEQKSVTPVDGSKELAKVSPKDSKLPSSQHEIAVSPSVQSSSVNGTETKNPPAVDVSAYQQATMCYEAGPFSNQGSFQTWRKLTGIDAKQIKQVTRNVDEADGYLVYFPAAETYDQSLMNFDELKLKGVSDLLIHRSGANRGEISLGFFSSENRALSHQQTLKTKEIEALIKPRYKPKKRIFAQINIAPELEENLIASKAKWSGNHPEIQISVSNQCAVKSP
ncbi:hypothetical protein GO003_013510 [Methylicorpusculum oleiharenae]|uniref:hypothetical protein n=1 Tax=Methylicorpusculum oleiharenae TaxID=1338687 RepID=UPI0013575620|nr:hypothetical protein [Methylicorpusculum oleiharenae]MCD2451408.1 hypothetical protein [Methylicorpusculum oleiharenae]